MLLSNSALTPTIPADAAHAIERLAHDVSAGDVAYEVLQNNRTDVLTVRAASEDGEHVVVKLWNRPTVKGALRRITRTNPGYREWRALSILHAGGVRVPRPIGYLRLLDPRCRHTEALVSQDLGKCGSVMWLIKRFIAKGDFQGLTALEDDIIEITTDIVNCGIVDVDHRLENLVISGNRLYNIDLEHGITVRSPRTSRRLGVMLGTLIGSYVFAVQPRVHLAESFARRLADRVKPGTPHVLRRAASVIQEMLERQRLACGIDSRLDLGW